MTNLPLSVTCQVIDCHQTATGRYLHVRQEGALEFQVCTGHFDRIERGEVPTVVPERLDLAELHGRLVLVTDPL